MKYESAGYAVSDPMPFPKSPQDTFAVWSATTRQAVDELFAPHVIEKMNHPLSYWSISTKGRTFTKEEYEEYKEEFKAESGPAWLEASSKIDEIEYDPHMTEDAIRYIVGRKNNKEFNDYIISKGRGGIVESVGKFGIEAAISILDPVISCFYFMTIPTGLFLILLLFLSKKYIMKLFRKTQ